MAKDTGSITGSTISICWTAYLAVYPDYKDALLFDGNRALLREACIRAAARRKYVLAGDKVRRVQGAARSTGRWWRTRRCRPDRRSAYEAEPGSATHGQGEVFRTTVFAKLVGLALIKFATLDPLGMGIEMEAGKPGWCDALNGLPGLFGSSLSETYELLRLLDFLLEATPLPPSPARRGGARRPLPAREGAEVGAADRSDRAAGPGGERSGRLSRGRRPRPRFSVWDTVATAREAYRASIRLGFDGRTDGRLVRTVAGGCGAIRDKVADRIARAEALTDGLPPTYFFHEGQDYSTINGSDGEPLPMIKGALRPGDRGSSSTVLPAFLEGSVHALRSYAAARSGIEASAGPWNCGKGGSGNQTNPRARALYERVKTSPLYDAQAEHVQDQCAAGVACSHEIGRLRAFTPGWLENESVFLHMAYKYLLEVLRAGLHDEFFADMRRGLVPFLDP